MKTLACRKPLLMVGVLALVFFIFAAPPQGLAAQDPEPVPVEMKVQGIGETLFEQLVEVVPPGEGQLVTALDALEQGLSGAGITYTLLDSDWGPFIHEIGGDTGGTFGGWDGWLYTVNGESPWVGAHEFELSAGDEVLFFYGRWAAISTGSDVAQGHEEPRILVELVGDEFNQDAADPANWEIDPGTTELVLDEIVVLDAQKAELAFQGTAAAGTLKIKAGPESLGGDGASNQLELVMGLNWEELEDALSEGEELLDRAQVGEEWGQHPQEAVEALEAAMEEARAYLGCQDAVQELIHEAAHQLRQAIALFKSREIRGDPSSVKETVEDVLAYYGENRALTSWWELVALRGAGADLARFELPEWNSQSLPEDAPATTHAGFILGLLARGQDPADAWGGRNLLEELAGKQEEDGSFGAGVNSTIWGIIALGSVDYPFHEDKALEYMLAQQLKDGGYTFFGDAGDPDLTAMALVALSLHRGKGGVDAAIEKALTFLEGIQLESGGFASWGNENANTIASVLTGLVSVGENIFSARWVQNPSIYDALMAFQLSDGSFSFLQEPLESNAMATSQALLALGDLDRGEPAYFRLETAREEDPPVGHLPETGSPGVPSLLLGFMALGAGFAVLGRSMRKK